MSKKKIKIVVTGGPSGGKTTLIDALKKEFGNKVDVVPETASILYRGGFPRNKTAKGLIHTQRAIYMTQKELEAIVLETTTAELVVCDRGSLDGIAYWPATDQDFFESLDTDQNSELNRYDWVLHLDTAGPEYYDTSNSIRTESYLEAKLLNEKTRSAWSGHKQRLVISDSRDFFKKMSQAMQAVHLIATGKSFVEIQQWLTKDSL